MAIWVGKQKMACKACIKGHRSSQCNHIGGPLWAVRPAGRPNKACIHGPGDLCLCAHYFPLTFLKAAVPRNKKCPCSGSVNGKAKCSCGASKNNDVATATTDDETHPIFYQDLVARGLQVTTEPVDLGVQPSSCCAPKPASTAAPTSVAASCCQPNTSPLAKQMSVPASDLESKRGCCTPPVKIEPGLTETVLMNGHPPRSDSISSAPFTPVQQLQSPPDFSDIKFESPMANGLHVCECGPTCNCVLCIDHPYNRATMNHINTEFGQMMSYDAPFSPTTGTQPDYFPQGWLANGGMMPPNFSDPALVAQYQMMQQQFMQQTPQQRSPQSYSPPSQAMDTDIILNPADFEMFNFAFPTAENGAENNSNGNGNLDMMDYGEMPDMNGFCGGATEACPCGDDCSCIGCQVHKPTNGNGIGLGLQQHWS